MWQLRLYPRTWTWLRVKDTRHGMDKGCCKVRKFRSKHVISFDNSLRFSIFYVAAVYRTSWLWKYNRFACTTLGLRWSLLLELGDFHNLWIWWFGSCMFSSLNFSFTFFLLFRSSVLICTLAICYRKTSSSLLGSFHDWFLRFGRQFDCNFFRKTLWQDIAFKTQCKT